MYSISFRIISSSPTGSSHGQCAFSWDALANERGYETFNFALTSQSFLYDYSLINMHKDDFSDGSILFIPVSYFSFNEEATDPADQEAISVRYYRILSPRYNPNYSLYKDLVTVRFPILSAGEEIFELFRPPVVFPSLSENKKNITYAAEAGMADAAAEAVVEAGTGTAPDTAAGVSGSSAENPPEGSLDAAGDGAAASDAAESGAQNPTRQNPVRRKKSTALKRLRNLKREGLRDISGILKTRMSILKKIRNRI